MQWYYSANNQQQGPVSEEQLKQLASTGVINDQSLVWREGMPDWQPFSTVKASFGVTPVPLGGAGGAGASGAGASGSAAVCPSCGNRTDANSLIPIGDTVVCPSCRDNYTQRLKEGGVSFEGGKPEGTGGQTPVFTLISQSRMALTGHWWPTIGFIIVYAIINFAIYFFTSIADAIIPLLGFFIQLFLTGQFTFGFAANMLSVSRGEGSEMGNIFVGFQDYGRILGVYILTAIFVGAPIFVGVMVAIGFLFITMPGGIDGFDPDNLQATPIILFALIGFFTFCVMVFLQVRLSMVYYIMRDFPAFGVMETIKYSWSMTRGLFWKIFWMGVVLSVIALAGMFALGMLVFVFSLMGKVFLGLGMFVAFIGLIAFILWYAPLSSVSYARLYDDI
ncbi:MAG: DUF975 family protein [Verrucomicrobiota bacterium]